MADHQPGALFRPIVPNQHSRVTYAELFFDLVLVFAVTQISHTLLGHFTRLGALQTGVLFLAVGGSGSTPPGSPTGLIPKRRRSACCFSC
jgi:hypothetical protein